MEFKELSRNVYFKNIVEKCEQVFKKMHGKRILIQLPITDVTYNYSINVICNNAVVYCGNENDMLIKTLELMPRHEYMSFETLDSKYAIPMFYMYINTAFIKFDSNSDRNINTAHNVLYLIVELQEQHKLLTCYMSHVPHTNIDIDVCNNITKIYQHILQHCMHLLVPGIEFDDVSVQNVITDIQSNLKRKSTQCLKLDTRKFINVAKYWCTITVCPSFDDVIPFEITNDDITRLLYYIIDCFKFEHSLCLFSVNGVIMLTSLNNFINILQHNKMDIELYDMKKLVATLNEKCNRLELSYEQSNKKSDEQIAALTEENKQLKEQVATLTEENKQLKERLQNVEASVQNHESVVSDVKVQQLIHAIKLHQQGKCSNVKELQQAILKLEDELFMINNAYEKSKTQYNELNAKYILSENHQEQLRLKHDNIELKLLVQSQRKSYENFKKTSVPREEHESLQQTYNKLLEQYNQQIIAMNRYEEILDNPKVKELLIELHYQAKK